MEATQSDRAPLSGQAAPAWWRVVEWQEDRQVWQRMVGEPIIVIEERYAIPDDRRKFIHLIVRKPKPGRMASYFDMQEAVVVFLGGASEVQMRFVPIGPRSERDPIFHLYAEVGQYTNPRMRRITRRLRDHQNQVA